MCICVVHNERVRATHESVRDGAKGCSMCASGAAAGESETANRVCAIYIYIYMLIYTIHIHTYMPFALALPGLFSI